MQFVGKQYSIGSIKWTVVISILLLILQDTRMECIYMYWYTFNNEVVLYETGPSNLHVYVYLSVLPWTMHPFMVIFSGYRWGLLQKVLYSYM